MTQEQFTYSSKNTFSAGELTPTIEGRNDLPIYQHGVKKLINWMILPSGGIIRRHGTEFAHLFTEKKPLIRCMMSLMYSREFSFLVIFSEVTSGKIKVEILINGTSSNNDTISLGEFDITLKAKHFSYNCYQGVGYVSFGLHHPIWSFFIDPEKIEFLSTLDTLSASQRQELFIFDVFTPKGEVYSNSNTISDATQMRTTKGSTQSELYRDLTMHQERDAINDSLSKADSLELSELKASSIAVFEGRLWALGTGRNIHEIWASSLGSMNEFNLAYKSLLEARNPLSAFAAVFNSAGFDRILWSIPFAKELLLGTTDGIYVLKTGDRAKDEFVVINKDVDMSISSVQPIICGKTIFFVEGDNKKIHSLYYSQEKGGYQISCITTYAEHLFNSGIRQIVGTDSPFNIIFAIMNNGSFASFTYSQDLKIMGWSQHWLGGDGKVIEAIALFTKNSDRVYFRVVRSGTQVEEIEGKLQQVKIDREYLEYFDCKYLTANVQGTIHTPLYADCYSHFQNVGEEEVEQQFKDALKDSNAFEFRGDLSNLEYLIIKQIDIERAFNESDILNNFLIGSVPLRQLENIEEIDNSDATIDEDERPVISIDLKPLYVEFIADYFSKHLKIIQLSLGLQMALVRMSQNFIAHSTNIVVGKFSDFSKLEEIKVEIDNIFSKLADNHQQLQQIIIPDTLRERSSGFIAHKSNSKYKFSILGVELLIKRDRLKFFQNLVKLVDRTIIRLKYYFSSSEFFIKDRKLKLLEDFNFKANYHLLKSGVSINVKSLDIHEYIAKSSKGTKGHLDNLEQINIEANNLAVSNYILDIKHNLEKNFIKYFAIIEDDLILNGGKLAHSNDEYEIFFQEQISDIIEQTYSAFDHLLIDKEIVLKEVRLIFEKFINLLGVIPSNIRTSFNIHGLIKATIDRETTSLGDSTASSEATNSNEVTDEEMAEYYRNLHSQSNMDAIYEDSIDETTETSSLGDKIGNCDEVIAAYTQYVELKSNIYAMYEAEMDDEDIDESIEDESDIVRQALKYYWLELCGESVPANWLTDLFGSAIEQAGYIDFERLVLIGFLIESKHIDDISSSAINDLENDCLYMQEHYPELQYYSNTYLIQLFSELINIERSWDDIISNLLKISNLIIPSEEQELLQISRDVSHPTKVDKYLLACADCFPIFRRNFPDIDIEMLKNLTHHMQGSIDRVDSEDLHRIYGGMETAFIGDNELLMETRISKYNSGAISLNGKYVRFLSFGFLYRSVLQTFPFIFPDEFEHVDKKDCAIGIKFFNSKGGYMEEIGTGGKVQYQFVNAAKLNLDNMQLYLPDKKYLMGDAINSITTPYISGWVHFSCNREISKDIDLVFIVDKPYPASILRIYAKAKLFPHYLN